METFVVDSDGSFVCLQKLSVQYPGEAGEREMRRLEALQESLEMFKQGGGYFL